MSGDASRLDSLTNSNNEVTHKRPPLTTVSKIQLVETEELGIYGMQPPQWVGGVDVGCGQGTRETNLILSLFG